MYGGSINIADILESHARTIGDRTAVITSDSTYSYKEINNRANKLANYLLDSGFSRGDHIAIHSRNRIEWIDAFYACLKIRAIPININYRYTRNELKYLYNISDTRGAIVSEEFLSDVIAIQNDLPKLEWVEDIESIYKKLDTKFNSNQDFEERSSDDLYIVYTGGTTGMPKGVVWRQEDLIYAAMNKARNGNKIDSPQQLSLEANKKIDQARIMCNSPMMHASGQWMMGSALIIGAVFILYTHKSFIASECLSIVEQNNVNSINIIGDGMAVSLINELKKNKYSLKSLISINNGGAFLSQQNKNELIKLLPHIFVMDVYGGSEVGSALAKIHTKDKNNEFKYDELIKIFDDSLNECSINTVGKIGRTGNIPLAYYNDSKKTNEIFKTINGIRWSIPGDLGYKTESDDIVLIGRDSSCINTGGEKVYPKEVESVITEYPDIIDAVVIGVEDKIWGEKVVCCFSSNKSIDTNNLKLFCKNNLADYKVPKLFIQINSIPRNEIGKVDFKKLKDIIYV